MDEAEAALDQGKATSRDVRGDRVKPYYDDPFAEGLRMAAVEVCPECAESKYPPEFQGDPEPAFWHEARLCRANRIWLKVRRQLGVT